MFFLLMLFEDVQVHCVLLGYITVGLCFRFLLSTNLILSSISSEECPGRMLAAPQDPSQFPGCCRAYYIYSTALVVFVLYIYIYIFYLFVGCCRCFARWDVTCLRSNASLRIRDPQLNFQFVSNDSHAAAPAKAKEDARACLALSGRKGQKRTVFYMFLSPSLGA